MSNSTKELHFMILQFLDDAKFKATAHMLERETGLYFDLNHFEAMVLEGMWDEAENYLSAFTKVKDNDHSTKIYYEMRKQKYFEALDNKESHKALDILMKDLKIFAPGNDALLKDLSHLLVVNDIREIKTNYKNAFSARMDLMFEIKKIIKQHPLLEGKLNFPYIPNQRLPNLLTDSMRQHQICNEEPNLVLNLARNRRSSAANQETRGDVKSLTNGKPINNMVSEEKGKRSLEDLMPNSIVEPRKKSKTVFDICRPSQCQFLQLPMHPEVNKIVRITYNKLGYSIFALALNGNHIQWIWPRTSFNIDGKANAQVCPQIWQPNNDIKFMANDLPSFICGNPVSCFALSKMGGYIISTSGGKISLFRTQTHETMVTIMPPPPMVTSVAFYPGDNNTFAIGFNDSTILIYFIRVAEVRAKLEGHSNRVTALAFSNDSSILISGDANAQIIVWNTSKWEKIKDRQLHVRSHTVAEVLLETHIQLHPNQMNFLVVHHSHLAIYETSELKCVNQWVQEVPVVISQATFSSDGSTVYALFTCGSVALFDASNFQMHCRVFPSAYLSPGSSLSICPVCIAAHPQKPTQFAVGMTDGSVYVIEPREPEGNWINCY